VRAHRHGRRARASTAAVGIGRPVLPDELAERDKFPLHPGAEEDWYQGCRRERQSVPPGRDLSGYLTTGPPHGLFQAQGQAKRRPPRSLPRRQVL